jgi:peptidyl-prolyl cis-trans isomerase B (cyclophilin B)
MKKSRLKTVLSKATAVFTFVFTFAIAALALGGLVACDGSNNLFSSKQETPTSTHTMSTETGTQTATDAGETAVIETTAGSMTFAFWPDVAPGTVANFKKLARERFYEGTAFHRIMKNFMIQGGCPNTRVGTSPSKKPGTGDPGYKIKAEFNHKQHLKGVISMARSSYPDSAGSQFFICHGDATFLNRQYTAFGELIAGGDVLDKIADTPVDISENGERSVPATRIEILSVKILPAANAAK